MSNETKFTLGPWKYVHEQDTRMCSSGQNAHKILAMSGDYEIIVSRINVSENEDIANANLIAAAPEMYEALRALSTGEGLQPGQTIESILLKARGEK